MDQLKLVWELEKYNDCIKEATNSLNELEDSDRLKALLNRFEQVESKVKQNKDRILDNNREITKLERLLKEYDYKKNKINNDIYNGYVIDMKQLDHLSREGESLSKKIDETELLILEMIDENDELDDTMAIFENELIELKSEIDELKDIIEKEIIRLKDLIHYADRERNNTIPSINNEILNRYEKLKMNKGKGIVMVNDHICGGCNMRISRYLMKDLRKGEEIIYCESCGRILYYLADEEEI